jgi:lambda family phage tail tape measure protein
MATNLNYDVSVSTGNAIQSLEKLQNKVSLTNNSFDKLKGALAGLAVGAAISSVIRFSDAISDLSDATNISVQSLLGFQSAVQSFGGDAESADKAILKLVTNIGEAANGSGAAQDALSRVGVTLADLKSMSEEDILRKSIDGLNKIGSASEQAMVKQALFGKEFRKVKTDGLADAYDQASAKALKYAESVKQAAAAQDVFDKVSKSVKLATIDLISPLTQLSDALSDDKLELFATSMTKLAASIVVISGLMWGLAKATAFVATNAEALGAVLVAFGSFAIGIGEVVALLAVLTTAAFVVNTAVKAMFDIDIVDIFTEKVKNAWRAMREFANLPRISTDSTAGAGRGGNKDTTAAQQARGEEMRKESDGVRQVTDAYLKQRAAIQQVSDDFAKANARIIDSINIENELIGQSKEYSDIVKAREELYKRSIDEIDKLRDAQSKLTAEEKRAGLGKNYEDQISKIEELTKAETDRVTRATRNANRLQQAEQIRQFGIKNEADMITKLKTIQDDIAKSSMTELEQKYYDIDAAAKDAARSAIAAEEARIGRKLDSNEAQKYYDKSIEGTDALKESTKSLYEASREFSTGWNRAFSDYVDSANNAANAARSIFSKVTSGMEDMIINFAKTGKWAWKDFANSVIEEMARIEIRKSIAGIATSGSKLLGFADGGLIPTNGPVIVGERGPEIISGAAGRTVTPNDQLGLGGASNTTNVTYNISAVDAMSFKQMVAADPSFMYAVTLRGQQMVPGAR